MRSFRTVYHPTLLLLLTAFRAGAQERVPDPGDCTGAIFIRDSVYVCERVGRGFGNVLEIKENPPEDKQWLEREHHSMWYTFRAPVKTTLTFDIMPKNIEDDIDFLLFQGAVPGICEKIQRKQVAPVRTNISRNDKSLGSMCGLSKESTDLYVRSGVGSSYSKAVEVEAGELLYLLVDYQERPLDGYTIRFHYDPPPPPPAPVKAERRQKLVVNVTDASTGTPVEAALTIDGMVFDSIVEAKGRSTYAFEMDPYRNLRIGCLRKGYLFYSDKVKATGEDVVTVNVKLTPIQAGEHVVLQDIRFVGNEEKVMRSSEAALLLLVQFMMENPSVKIEIEGHVNGPTYKNSKEFIALSAARARTVHDFLLINDVDPTRIKYVGLGNSRMLFPDPKNKEESEANRRVEVNILSR
ncbi:MAG: OmpA family protein [Bacteroidetes bacterium]|nr:OmpA family protein [Bacteroidota bacterium]